LGLSIRYSREQEPLGTGGAVGRLKAIPHSDPILVFNGDSLLHVSLPALVEFHRSSGAEACIAITAVENRARFGSVVVGEQGLVSGFEEKGAQGPGWINAGIYTFSRAFIATIPDGPASMETEVFPAHSGKDLYAYRAAGDLVDIGTPDAYARAQKMLASSPRT
jgi:NDP-sugar pyrophosphorylase family protein